MCIFSNLSAFPVFVFIIYLVLKCQSWRLSTLKICEICIDSIKRTLQALQDIVMSCSGHFRHAIFNIFSQQNSFRCYSTSARFHVLGLYFSLLNPIWRGRDNFVQHQKFFPIISIWVKLHKNVVRYVLEIYFSCFFQEKKISTCHVTCLWCHFWFRHEFYGQTLTKSKVL